MTSLHVPQPAAVADSRLYRAVWRWHFYAGLFVAPILAMLALSGLVMLAVTGIAPETGEWRKLPPGGEPLAVSAQIGTALAAHPGGSLGKYVTPWGPDRPALVRVDLADGNRIVTLDPYRGTILADLAEDTTWKALMTRLHGTLFLGGDGGPGDAIIEVAASLGIVLIVTGLYLWWPRAGTVTPVAPVTGTRASWKRLHGTTGAWMSAVLLFFLISGLAWAGVWGGRMVQPWSSFPAEKWDNVPLSDKAHASMNHSGLKDVPWALEQTPMPESGSAAGSAGVPAGAPVDADALVALGRSLGFTGRFQITPPAGETGVWTLSQDSMSYDSGNPMGDRTVHVDQYSGQVLADVRFADYPVVGKMMAAGIALHEGQLGWWNVALNALFCLAVLFACVSGAVMWWKRRPAGRLAAPRYPRDFRPGWGVAALAMALGLAFPMGGLAMIAFAIADALLPRRFRDAGFDASR